MESVIEAAGGLVWRRNGSQLEVLLVHRPLRDDWTLPVGRLELDETIQECALREVAEETGYRCEAGDLLTTFKFVGEDDGRVHRFHIFAMQPVSGEFVPNPETDRADWFTVEDAVERATYDSVKDLVANAEGTLPKP